MVSALVEAVLATARAFVLYHYAPYDLSIWGKLRSPAARFARDAPPHSLRLPRPRLLPCTPEPSPLRVSATAPSSPAARRVLVRCIFKLWCPLGRMSITV